MRRRLPSLLAWAAPLLAVAAAAQEPSGRPLDLWPLVVHDARPVAGRATTRIGGPFFERWNAGAERGFTLRPLLARIVDEERAERSVEFLYPLGEWNSSDDGERFRLTPLVDRVERPEEEGGKRGWSFGLAFGGRTDEGEGYFGIFPVGGVAKQRFGRERLDFWLFPLFARSRDESGYTKTHVLWPFFTFGSGGGRRTLRIWPFYGHDVREGEFDRRFALWPFVHWRTERPGDPTLEKKTLFVLPFYGRTERPQARAHFVLGPLYMRAENDLTGATQTDVLWPFLRHAQRPPSETRAGSRELRVEPFYRRREAPGFLQVGTLFGALRRTTVRREDFELDGFRALWLSRIESSHEPATGLRVARRQVWPFYRRVEVLPADAPPAGSLQAPWILPVAGEGWMRHLQGLLTLYDHRFEQGEERTDWLYGLVRSRRAPGYRLDALSWVVRREAEASKRRLRILGLPLEWETAPPSVTPTLHAADAD